MIEYKFVLIFMLIGLLWLSFALLDAKYNLRLLSWINGETKHPFRSEGFHKSKMKSFDSKSQKEEALQDEILKLKERIQVLEKIVSEPSYELKKEFDKLAKQ
uniref:hypothetical protein n=1 Tax=Ningiella ruwaisensis TaxID=2364274 RepID=UPI0010A033AC|nr:hypothetical protein [Ningiella ruwaisensis]